MKRQWQPEELIEHFILLPKERELLPTKTNATAHNQLSFAVRLKFFQYAARFPLHKNEVPRVVVTFIGDQLGIPYEQYLRSNWSGRTVERHRSQIRAFLGFRAVTRQDEQDLRKWLLEYLLPHGYRFEQLKDLVYQRLRDARIEPPAPEQVERLIHAATYTFEETFCTSTLAQLSPETCIKIDALLSTTGSPLEERPQSKQSDFSNLKTDPGRISLDTILREFDKLQCIRNLGLPANLFTSVSAKILQQYRQRASSEPPRELRRHPAPIRYTLVAAFCWLRSQEITDSLVELLSQIVHRIGVRAERRVEKELIADFKRVDGKTNLLFRIAEVSLEHPDKLVKEIVYPVASKQTLENLVKEYKSTGSAFVQKVYVVMRASYLGHYRRMVPQLLTMLEFRSNNHMHQPVIQALELLKKYQGNTQRYYAPEDEPLIDGVLKRRWRDLVVEVDKEERERINRINYELCVLQALREQLRSKEIWVVGAKRYCNPEEDLPQDFERERQTYYQALKQPLEAESFIARLQEQMTEALNQLNQGMPTNRQVKILRRNNDLICVSPLIAQPEPMNLVRLKTEIGRRWPMTSLLDVLKETDFRVQFTEQFRSAATRESMERFTLQKRLLLCLYGLGTNAGLKRVCAGTHRESYADLQYVKRRFIHKEHLRNAIAQVANAIFQARKVQVWGEATTACASDSKKFGAYDQNLLTEWHVRYGGRGVVVYWHVDKKSACIYSQLKTCSSSEVAAMIEGVLRHCTDMKVEKNYVDSHGQSEIAFAFCHLLGFQLLPRLKRIKEQKLYLPQPGQGGATYPHLQAILRRSINWELIRQQYDQMIKYATALKVGTAETEVILKRFNRSTPQHPTYQALAELGKAVKTIFLCQYLHFEALRQEIQDGLNVVERWNGANTFILYGKSNELATNSLDEQHVTVLCMHLLQLCLVYINTLMIQRVLGEKQWSEMMQLDDFRALTPLIWAHVNPYGLFQLDMNERLTIEEVNPELAG
ncbi:MAG: Tn3 family transposase [Chroococcidiopsidaceae cyanobacterium CP_BM_RX_35]|nr:Tn3 family transposase [Chroococcidiopsidaceae cyanobacterium CP_BM_RX_35]